MTVNALQNGQPSEARHTNGKLTSIAKEYRDSGKRNIQREELDEVGLSHIAMQITNVEDGRGAIGTNGDLPIILPVARKIAVRRGAPLTDGAKGTAPSGSGVSRQLQRAL